MPYRTDVQPQPVAHATKYVSNFGTKFFATAEDRDRFDSLVRSGAVRLDAAQRLDARQAMIKRDSEASKQPLGAELFKGEK